MGRLCLGTLNFGVRTSKADSFRMMDEAVHRGVNLFDTANHYGWQIHKGLSEEIIGEWFATGAGRRDDVVLATKVYNPMTDWPNDSGLSARHIIASCEQSLRRLRTDWIDLFQMHHVDRAAPWDEVWQAMEVLVAQGKVRYVGSSNFAGWHLAEAQETADARHFLGIASEQCIYNLITRHAESDLIPAARAYGIGVLTWSPLHGGLLGGALRKLDEGTAVKTAQGRAMAALETHRDTIAEYEKVCGNAGLDPAEVAMRWTLSQPGIDGIVTGPRTMTHFEGSLRALELELDDDLLAELERLFPAPPTG
ncbi:aldo/keto reductase [Actinosynnema sp. NPDC023587]|uniref:aldo/keto reductase n=1 Tax=Actinosynnema sp. NPDC023587 TaxID=3154695 RepID=UPI0034037056